jgi:hypothetical protein
VSDDPARGRFAAMQLARLAGVALVIAALLVLRQRIDLPEAAGWIMLLSGLAGAFLAPQLLARKWRSGGE